MELPNFFPALKIDGTHNNSSALGLIWTNADFPFQFGLVFQVPAVNFGAVYILSDVTPSRYAGCHLAPWCFLTIPKPYPTTPTTQHLPNFTVPPAEDVNVHDSKVVKSSHWKSYEKDHPGRVGRFSTVPSGLIRRHDKKFHPMIIFHHPNVFTTHWPPLE